MPSPAQSLSALLLSQLAASAQKLLHRRVLETGSTDRIEIQVLELTASDLETLFRTSNHESGDWWWLSCLMLELLMWK